MRACSITDGDDLRYFTKDKTGENGNGRESSSFWKHRYVQAAAVTFLELMLSITIVLAACSIVFPLVNTGRKSADVNVCLSNLREITAASTFYAKDSDPIGSGSHPTQPWYVNAPEYSYSYMSEFVYGGFQTQVDNPHYPNSDTYKIPTERRPFNKYIAPDRIGRQPLAQYICPSDKSNAVPLIGAGGVPPWSTSGSALGSSTAAATRSTGIGL